MPEVNLKAERLNRGLSAQGVADKIGVQKNVLLNAESGASVPRPATALKIADFYGYRVTDIWPVETSQTKNPRTVAAAGGMDKRS